MCVRDVFIGALGEIRSTHTRKPILGFHQQKTNLVTRPTQQSDIDRVEVCYTKNPLHASQVQCGGGKQSNKASLTRLFFFLLKETGQRQFSELLKNV